MNAAILIYIRYIHPSIFNAATKGDKKEVKNSNSSNRYILFNFQRLCVGIATTCSLGSPKPFSFTPSSASLSIDRTSPIPTSASVVLTSRTTRIIWSDIFGAIRERNHSDVSAARVPSPRCIVYGSMLFGNIRTGRPSWSQLHPKQSLTLVEGIMFLCCLLKFSTGAESLNKSSHHIKFNACFNNFFCILFCHNRPWQQYAEYFSRQRHIASLKLHLKHDSKWLEVNLQVGLPHGSLQDIIIISIIYILFIQFLGISFIFNLQAVLLSFSP